MSSLRYRHIEALSCTDVFCLALWSLRHGHCWLMYMNCLIVYFSAAATDWVVIALKERTAAYPYQVAFESKQFPQSLILVFQFLNFGL